MTNETMSEEDLADLARWAEHRYETDQVFAYKADRASDLAFAACPMEIPEMCHQAMRIGAIVALYLEGAPGDHDHSREMPEVRKLGQSGDGA